MSTASSAPHPQPSPRQFGIDLGGTKTEVVVLDETGATLLRERRPTPSADYADIVANIVSLVRFAESRIGSATALGVGAPGAPVPSTGLLKNANTTCLIGQPLQSDLSQRLKIPVYVENDANCFTLSESVDGAGSAAKSVFGVILGTGVGGGLYLRDGLIRGLHHIAGEWGHNPLPRRACTDAAMAPLNWGRPCYCGLTDCIETYLSGPGLSRTFEELSTSSVGAKAITADQISQLAQSGHAVALRVLDLYATQLAASLASVINLIDPEVIVLGGGVSNDACLYQSIIDRLPAYVFTNGVKTRVVRAQHGDSSGVRGAAWLSQYAV